MVIKTEFGNENGIVIRTQVRRGVLKMHLPSLTEGFLAQNHYRWGKMYSLKGKEQMLIREF